MKIKRMLLASALSISLIAPAIEVTPINDVTVQAASVKAIRKKIKKRAKKASKESKQLDDYPVLTKYKLHFNGKKLISIQVYCDESLANADQSELRHYFRYGIEVGMGAIRSTSKSPIVQVYSGNSMVARSKVTNNMTFTDIR